MLRELNVVRKRFRRGCIRVAIAYPSTYSVGMTSLSTHMLYNFLNERESIIAERVFLEGDGPYVSIESGTPLSKFDAVIFTVHYELDYANIVRMLVRSGIPPLSRGRGKDHPLIVIGGLPVIANPEPLAEIADVILIGEIECVLPRFVSYLVEYGKDVVDRVDDESIYVPSRGKHSVRRGFVKDINNVDYPVRQIIALEAPLGYEQVFGRSFLLEIMRGCPHMCKFCLECYAMYPARFRSFGKIRDVAERGLRACNVNKVALLGLSVTDHPDFKRIVSFLLYDLKVEISLPSLRADRLREDDLDLLSAAGQKVLTIAPESSARLRKMLGKDFDDTTLINVAKMAAERGFDHVKLYFMVGVPNETKEDLDDIIRLTRHVKRVCRSVYVSVNPLVPKPLTPMQWIRMESVDELNAKIRYVKRELSVRMTTYDPVYAVVQALLSLGDRDVVSFILDLGREGSPYDKGALRRLMRAHGSLFKKYVFNVKSVEDELPWSHVDHRVPKDLLVRKYEELHVMRPF